MPKMRRRPAALPRRAAKPTAPGAAPGAAPRSATALQTMVPAPAALAMRWPALAMRRPALAMATSLESPRCPARRSAARHHCRCERVSIRCRLRPGCSAHCRQERRTGSRRLPRGRGRGRVAVDLGRRARRQPLDRRCAATGHCRAVTARRVGSHRCVRPGRGEAFVPRAQFGRLAALVRRAPLDPAAAQRRPLHRSVARSHCAHPGCALRAVNERPGAAHRAAYRAGRRAARPDSDRDHRGPDLDLDRGFESGPGVPPDEPADRGARALPERSAARSGRASCCRTARSKGARVRRASALRWRRRPALARGIPRAAARSARPRPVVCSARAAPRPAVSCRARRCSHHRCSGFRRAGSWP